mmetsp:Transcript_39576/g.77493  ORF Transcript_39576/g.77493 Transcript_39576/m.77493 type:complete len:209 (+) Transcript_39576:121-747(+)
MRPHKHTTNCDVVCGPLSAHSSPQSFQRPPLPKNLYLGSPPHSHGVIFMASDQSNASSMSPTHATPYPPLAGYIEKQPLAGSRGARLCWVAHPSTANIPRGAAVSASLKRKSSPCWVRRAKTPTMPPSPASSSPSRSAESSVMGPLMRAAAHGTASCDSPPSPSSNKSSSPGDSSAHSSTAASAPFVAWTGTWAAGAREGEGGEVVAK